MTSPAQRRRLLAALVAAACLMLLSACGSGAKTGNSKLLKTTGPAGCGQIICETTPPPTTPGTQHTTPAVRHTTAPPKQTAKPVVTKKPAAAKPFDIYINGDKSGKSLIDPPQAAVYAGTVVIWHNTDTVAHGVQAQNGGFNSGDIRPGGTFSWVAKAPGTYAYQDTKRPYVNASLQVAPR